MNLTQTHGRFDDNTHEYVITNRHTPRAWHNYLCNKNWMVNMTQLTAMTAGFYENGSVCMFMETDSGCWRWRRPAMPTKLSGPGKRCCRWWTTNPTWTANPTWCPTILYRPGERAQRNLFLSGWRTGSAAWMWMALWEGLLGFESGYDALTVTPRLPAAWDQVTLRRTWRGCPVTVKLQKGADAPATVKLPAGQGGDFVLSV